MTPRTPKIPTETEEKKPQHKNRGKAARNKGHKAERELAQMFRDIGFQHACTTRASSRQLDACGIDLNYVPLIIQSKAGAQKGLNHAEELKYIQDRMAAILPIDEPWHGKAKAIVQMKSAPKGRRRNEYDSLVTMTLGDFMTLVKKAFAPLT